MPPRLHIVAALIADDQGRVLMVRKRGTRAFIHPGGKRRPGESSRQTLLRELNEELGIQVVPGSLVRLGCFEEWAVNEPGLRVRSEVFLVRPLGHPRPQAEISELRWMDPRAPDRPLAPMSQKHVLPAWLAREAGRWHVLDLGDPLLAAAQKAELVQIAQQEFEQLGRPDGWQLGSLHVAGDLHCSLRLYFSPPAQALALRLGARPARRPDSVELEWLAGSEQDFQG